jgi:NRAMP (natural resistance-associated macrophage protein)-like metal ion transporter
VRDRTFNDLIKRLGPGFITGTSDDDPSAIGTYSQTGAQFGLSQLWTALFTFPMMAAIQEMCGRIGLVSGRGVASNVRRHFAKPVLYFIVSIQVVTNTVNVGADLSAMAESGRLLWHVPYGIWLATVTCGTLGLIILVPYRAFSTYLKFVGLTLLTYVAAAFTLKVDWRAVIAATFVPTITLQKAFLLNLVAVLGTTISPYEFFWQSNEEVDELIEDRVIKREGIRPPERSVDLTFLRWDTMFGMFFSNAIMYFIILLTAYTLSAHGVTNVDTAEKAAQALRPFAGPLAFWLFTAGIITAGLMSIPVLAASSGYALSGAFGWRATLAKEHSKSRGFFAVIVATALVGLTLNFLPIPPFKLLYYAAVLNGFIAPPLLFIILRLANNPEVMGRHVNSPLSNVLGWTLFALMTLSVVALLAFGTA